MLRVRPVIAAFTQTLWLVALLWAQTRADGIAAGGAPTADAGPDLAIAIGKAAVLDGTASSDPEGDRLTYRWSICQRSPDEHARALQHVQVEGEAVPRSAGTYVVELVVGDGQSTSVADQAVITTVNTVPVANSGPDRSVPLAMPVQLDGTASSDVDEQTLSHTWKLKRPKGSSAVLTDPASARPLFVPDKPGNYVATLTVSDGTLKKTDTVTMTTNGNVPPVARAGRDRRALLAGQTIVLDASDSADANGDALAYVWTITKRPGASTATLDSPNTVRSSFTADVKGNYTFTLVVTDSVGASSTDQVVYKTDVPVAYAGADRVVAVGSTVTVDGSGSSHLSTSIRYGWAFVSRPPGSTATLLNPADPQPAFVADVAGTYVAQLIVFDGVVLSAADTVVVTAGDNASPRVELGPDQVTAVSTLVTLDGIAAIDPDGGAMALRWALLARPPLSSAAVSAATGGSTQLTVDVPGAYVVQLMAADADGLSASDTIVIATAKGRPTVSAGPDLAAGPLSPITLGAAARRSGTSTTSWAATSSTSGRRCGCGSRPGRRRRSLTVTPLFDVALEPLETVVLTAEGTPATATIADEPAATIAATDATAAELGGDTATFTVTRGGATPYDRDVLVSIGGTAQRHVDYVLGRLRARLRVDGAGADPGRAGVGDPDGHAAVRRGAGTAGDRGADGRGDAGHRDDRR